MTQQPVGEGGGKGGVVELPVTEYLKISQLLTHGDPKLTT